MNWEAGPVKTVRWESCSYFVGNRAWFQKMVTGGQLPAIQVTRKRWDGFLTPLVFLIDSAGASSKASSVLGCVVSHGDRLERLALLQKVS